MKAILDSARLPIRIVMFTAFALLSVAPNAQTQLSTPNAQAQPSAPDAITTTQRQYLSGHGPKDAIPWEFTVSDGRRAGEKTTIPVPSQWEQHGFGAYNYGSELNKAGERGLYRTRFRVPAAWRDCRIRLVFGAVMTDATVTVNGQPAGPTHQGGFTQFSYDVTKLLKPGADNELVVDVAKVSADAATERAERKGDYWVFGGIYRPVWLEAVPARFIEHVAIDAGADGRLTADITLNFLPEPRRPDGPTLVPETLEARLLDADGQPAAAPVIAKIPAGGTGRMRVAMQADAPRLWTAETPHLYVLRVTRHRGDKALHTVDTRFGFRTFEVRDGDGLYLNGQRILLKGVNRHSFRPATGRALDREDCYADARMIRSMNMNAVRMSHYPPDTAFLEACDELGLYVIDELSGWQAAHGTPIARLLVRELVERDVNHPSILLWSNGNEGGWNRDLDGDYALYDPQQRRVIHAWDPFGGIDTRHYTRHSEHMRRLNGPHLVMPTEILHGLHDGGAGAGLHDYWHALAASKVGAGMFIWDYADAGIARTDRDGKIDVFSTYGPDGILGPNLEKDGSYYAIKHIWSPVQIAPASPGNPLDGRLQIHNRYDFTPLDRARLKWRWLRWNGDAEKTLAQGETPLPPIAPHAHGELTLPPPPPAAAGKDAHALAVTAINPHGEELWTWTWPTPALAAINAQPDRDTPAPTLEQTGDTTIVSIACDWPAPAPTLEKTGDTIRLSAAGTSATLDAATGELRALRRSDRLTALSHGPRLAFVRPPAPEVPPEWMPWSGEETNGDIIIRRLASPQIASVLEAALDLPKAVLFASFKLEISPDGREWKTLFDASRRPADGAHYTFPPQPVASVRISGLTGFAGHPAKFKTLRLGHTPARFPALSPSSSPPPPLVPSDARGGDAPPARFPDLPTLAAPLKITTGETPATATESASVWLESRAALGLEHFRWTLFGDGRLRLDYAYRLDGAFACHGITFDHPESALRAVRWLGEGPNRVWQNRLQGTRLGVHETPWHAMPRGETFQYSESAGYFAGVRWARLAANAGDLVVRLETPSVYLRLGTPRITVPSTMAEFPAGDLSFLHAIPGMASKFKTIADSGPSAAPAEARGEYRGTVLFELSP